MPSLCVVLPGFENVQHRYFIFLTFCLFLQVLWLGQAAGADDDLEASRQQLQQIEQRLEKAITDLAAKKKVETDLNRDLEGIERQLRKMQRRADSAAKRLRKLDGEVSAAQRDLKRSRQEVEDMRNQVQQRLTALYKSEEAGMIKAVFSAHSLSQLFEDYDYLGRIVRHDRQLLDTFREKVRLSQQAFNKLALVHKKQQTLSASLHQQEIALRRSQKIKNKFLQAVRKDRGALNSMVADLQEKAERLSSLVDELSSASESSRTESDLFSLQQGILLRPVAGKVQVGFGRTKHPELGTLFDSHGIEISTEPDVAVKAVWSGRVAFAKSFKGYGNLIIVDHDGGYYTLYAQIDRLQKQTGDLVQQGEVLAYTGFEGSDHLYFEIRKGRTPIDPLPWFEKR